MLKILPYSLKEAQIDILQLEGGAGYYGSLHYSSTVRVEGLLIPSQLHFIVGEELTANVAHRTSCCCANLSVELG